MVFSDIWMASQIVIESFPVSSSGHILLLEHLYGCLHNMRIGDAFPFATIGQKELIVHLLHGPTLVIIGIFFFKDWFFLLKNMFKCSTIILKIILLTLISSGITASMYFLLKNVESNVHVPLTIGFIVTALILVSTAWCTKNNKTLDVNGAIVLGIAQSVALLPGISRLAITYACARWLGISSYKALRISFLIQIPLIMGAFLLSLFNANFYIAYNQILNLHAGLVILVAMVLSGLGLWITAQLAYANRWWIFAIYLIIPITVSIFMCR